MENIKLNDGHSIPALGMGVFMVSPEDCEKQLATAFECGYRHIDTANIYMNERAVGRALKAAPVPREDIFLTTKLWPVDFGYDKACRAIDATFARLDTEYIDLLLLHRPFNDYIDAWKALENAVKDGRVRSIGVSNFEEKHIKKLLDKAEIRPALDQIECHPYCQRKKLKRYLDSIDIALESWYPLGHKNKKMLADPLFAKLSTNYGKTPVQIILRWHVQEGFIVIPKTLNVEHMKQNLEVFDFSLSDNDMEAIRNIDKNKQLAKLPVLFEKINCCLPRDFNKQS